MRVIQPVVKKTVRFSYPLVYFYRLIRKAETGLLRYRFFVTKCVTPVKTIVDLGLLPEMVTDLIIVEVVVETGQVEQVLLTAVLAMWEEIVIVFTEVIRFKKI